MKKRILSITLVFLLLFTMTACSETEEPNLSTTPIIESQFETQPEITKPQDPHKIEDCLEIIYLEDFEKLTLEEVNTLAENLVYSSQTANLSPWDMYEMGTMFYFISEHPEYDKVKFEKEFCEAFDNVHKHATEIGVTLDILQPWIEIPVAEVMCKYLSDNNFEKPVELWCHTINKLPEEDLALVTKSFVNNPTMAVNADIARSIICATNNEETANMAWEHLLKLSSSDVVSELIPFYTGHICFDIFTNQDLVYTEEILLEKLYTSENMTQIARNILTNPSFDFIEKYSYFCNDFFEDYDVDVEIFQNVVLESLDSTLNTYTIGERRDLAQALHKASYKNFDKLPEELQREYNLILLNCLVEMY